MCSSQDGAVKLCPILYFSGHYLQNSPVYIVQIIEL